MADTIINTITKTTTNIITKTTTKNQDGAGLFNFFKQSGRKAGRGSKSLFSGVTGNKRVKTINPDGSITKKLMERSERGKRNRLNLLGKKSMAQRQIRKDYLSDKVKMREAKKGIFQSRHDSTLARKRDKYARKLSRKESKLIGKHRTGKSLSDMTNKEKSARYQKLVSKRKYKKLAKSGDCSPGDLSCLVQKKQQLRTKKNQNKLEKLKQQHSKDLERYNSKLTRARRKSETYNQKFQKKLSKKNKRITKRRDLRQSRLDKRNRISQFKTDQFKTRMTSKLNKRNYKLEDRLDKIKSKAHHRCRKVPTEIFDNCVNRKMESSPNYKKIKERQNKIKQKLGILKDGDPQEISKMKKQYRNFYHKSLRSKVRKNRSRRLEGLAKANSNKLARYQSSFNSISLPQSKQGTSSHN